MIAQSDYNQAGEENSGTVVHTDSSHSSADNEEWLKLAAVSTIACLEMTTPKDESASQLLQPASSEVADDDSSLMSCEKGSGDQLGSICFYLDCFECKTPILSHITNTNNPPPLRKEIISGECNNVMMIVMVMVVGPIKNHCQYYTQVKTSEGRK